MSETWLKAVFPCIHTPRSSPQTLHVHQLPGSCLPLPPRSHCCELRSAAVKVNREQHQEGPWQAADLVQDSLELSTPYAGM